jgi:hypothetical protein
VIVAVVLVLTGVPVLVAVETPESTDVPLSSLGGGVELVSVVVVVVLVVAALELLSMVAVGAGSVLVDAAVAVVLLVCDNCG